MLPPVYINDEEKNEFLQLTRTIQAGNYKEALEHSKILLEKYPNNKGIYHNQIGALAHNVEGDYWYCSKHYVLALENGFDAGICEENLWESAVDGYNRLIDSENGFCVIFYPDEPERETTKANKLIEDYIKLFPEGQFMEEAKELNFVFYEYYNLKNENNLTSITLKNAYLKEYTNGKYGEIVEKLCSIIDENNSAN
jgi:hypothetical protein